MLAQHLINVEARGDCRVLLEVSDLNRARATIMENQPQLARPYENRCVADRRVGGHSALKVRRRRLVVADFADQFELRHCDITCARRRLVGPQAHVGDEPGQQRFSGAYAEKLADSRAHLLGTLRRRRRQADASLRAADGDNVTELLDVLHSLLPSCWCH
jgi:hypothetical protein